MKDYEVKITESSRNFDARERIMMKDKTNAVSLDKAVQPGEQLTITPEDWAVLDVHNEASIDKDYKNYLITDVDGVKYCTGSESFWRAFRDIWDEMQEAQEEFQICIYKLESKKYAGKSFLTCSIV